MKKQQKLDNVGVRTDAIESFNNRIGGANRDQTQNFTTSEAEYLNQEIVDRFYTTLPFCRRACDAPPEYAFRKWGHLKVVDKENRFLIEALTKQMDEINTRFYFTRAQIEAHKRGGAGLVMLIDDGNMDKFDKPVRYERIKAVRGLRLFTGEILVPDDLSYYQGSFEPEYYRLGTPTILSHDGRPLEGGIKVHCSRVLPFVSSAPLSKELGRRLSNGWWGDSVIRQCYEAAQWYLASNQAVAHALQSFEVTNVKIQGLIDRINSSAMEGKSYSKAVEARMESIQKLYTLYGILVTDMEEEGVENTSRQFTNVDNMIESLERLLIATTNLPKFILFRQYGSQLGQLGEHEQNDFDLLIGQEQSRVLPNINKLIKAIFSSKEFATEGTIPEGCSWQWYSLREKSDEQISKERNLDSQTFEKYISLGVLTPEEVKEIVRDKLEV